MGNSSFPEMILRESLRTQNHFNMGKTFLLVLQCLSVACFHLSLLQKRKCVFQQRKNLTQFSAGTVNGSVQLCEETQCCVAIYKIINGQPIVHTLGCDVKKTSCPESCLAKSFKNGYFHCRCGTDLCNGNVTWTSEPEQPLQPSNSADVSTLIIQVAVVVVVLFFAVFIIINIKWKTKMKNLDEEETLPSSCNDYSIQPSCSSQTTVSGNDITDIELQEVIGRGRFAKVFRGRYNKCVVAVKVYPAHWKPQFIREKEIYELPLMEHSGIVQFFGTGRKPDDGSWLIVLEHAEYGSLHSFLCENTSSWEFSLKMCQTLSQGLSYLHSNLLSHDARKPQVAHRDLSSSNVLVRADGSCALCDFGFSTILHSCSGQQCRMAKMKSHTQFGTLHYMPPEILEGSVNLNSRLFAMKGDVYALSLILWEIWMRCSDLFKGGVAPQHHLPYEQELEANVTWERLIRYVSDMGMRPSIPEHWDTLQQGSELKELLEDCWDQDTDARLTASCVENRLASLQASYSQ